MSTSSAVLRKPAVHLSAKYALGVLLRVVVVTGMILGGLALMQFLLLVNQSGRGMTLLESEVGLYSLIEPYFLLIVPIAVALLIAECQVILLCAVGLPVSSIIVLVPASLGIVGAFLGMLLFVGAPSFDTTARVFILGTGLLFYLAGSFQLWFWQEWVGSHLSLTPLAWYAVAMFLAGGFLGSMVAWNAPSPYMRKVVDYYEETWRDRASGPPFPIDPSSDLPI